MNFNVLKWPVYRMDNGLTRAISRTSCCHMTLHVRAIAAGDCEGDDERRRCGARAMRDERESTREQCDAMGSDAREMLRDDVVVWIMNGASVIVS